MINLYIFTVLSNLQKTQKYKKKIPKIQNSKNGIPPQTSSNFNRRQNTTITPPESNALLHTLILN